MIGITLSEAEVAVLKELLIDFVKRVSGNENQRRPEEIAILPAVMQLLLNASEGSSEKTSFTNRVSFGKRTVIAKPDSEAEAHDKIPPNSANDNNNIVGPPYTGSFLPI